MSEFGETMERLYGAANTLGLHLCFEPVNREGVVIVYVRSVENDQFAELPQRWRIPGAGKVAS